MSALDWAISMGIFLLAIVSIFVFLKPATVPLYDEINLIPILERGIVEDIYWSVNEIPLFIGSSCGAGGGGWSIEVTNNNAEWAVNGQEIYLSGEDQKETKYIHYYPQVDNPSGLDLTIGGFGCAIDGVGKDTYIGTIETISGINGAKLALLNDVVYDSTKLDWGFPEINDFAVYRDDIKIMGGDPIGQRNVFVSIIKDFIVSNNGVKTPVEIKLAAW